MAAAQKHHPTATFFGHLIPLGDGNETLPLPDSTTTLLSLPGSFGRTELLQPYSKMKCSTCRHIKKEAEKEKSAANVILLCHVCQSIQSFAKFIPRENFLNFAYQSDDDSSKQQQRRLVMTVSGRNTAKLVQVSSPRCLNSIMVGGQTIQDGMIMTVNDCDIISLCWYLNGSDNISSKELKPLIRFRVAKCSKTADPILSKKVDSPLQKKIEQTQIILCGGLKADDRDYLTNESHRSADTHNEAEPCVIFSLDDATNHCRNEANKSNGQESSQEEEESAPLSLPSKFLGSSSKSFSFDSPLYSVSPPKATSHAAAKNCSTSSEKRKTPPPTGDATKSSFSTSKTPKKSNVKAPNQRSNDETLKETIPLSSLSYDQLLQLRDQSTASSSTSLRQRVLSLALALNSNASTYDSNFLREVSDFTAPAKTTRKSFSDEGSSGSKVSNSKNCAGGEAITTQWMPRLLQGTNIVLKKKSNEKT